MELYVQFDSLISAFKKHVVTYDDDIKVFKERECNKIPYFRTLSILTQLELIFAMERETYEKDYFICKKDEIAHNMFVIHEGVVEIVSTYDRKGSRFVIERLGRGAIINPSSFLLKDDSDTDFKCLTTVSAFVLSYEKMKIVKQRRQDLKNARKKVQEEVLRPLYPIALDYVFHNHDYHNYE